MISIDNIEAVILAGGKSSRMGEDKGLVKLDGKPMITYNIDLLRRMNIPFRIVSHLKAYGEFGCEVICDSIPDKGPMGGLYTALLDCRADSLLLLSCDSPFISEELVNYLLNRADNTKISVTVFRDKLYPMCSIYPKSLLPLVKSFIETDNLKMKNLIASSPFQRIEVDELLMQNSHTLSNFNSKTDIENFIKARCYGN